MTNRIRYKKQMRKHKPSPLKRRRIFSKVMKSLVMRSVQDMIYSESIIMKRLKDD